MNTIIPAFIPTSRENFDEQHAKLSYAHEIHIDMVDGVFAQPASWPYPNEGSLFGDLSSIQLRTDAVYEVDLMVAKPLPVMLSWAQIGVQKIVFHAPTVTRGEFTEAARRLRADFGVQVGIAVQNGAPYESLQSYLQEADYVQVMGIAEVGKQGQAFDERTFERIAAIVRDYPDLERSVDGSVNEQTIAHLHEAGAQRFVVGSAIMKTDDAEAAQQVLLQIIQSA